ncbi:unnamed protein product [Arctia plantaginis]|uniref:Uncharacterized protein n=1 Tax=Arctia plantaginis TaxID=874455 RepID=A0A8S0ZGK7_ARCPL|nr:unnamed protein product [Arctia plantaginis]
MDTKICAIIFGIITFVVAKPKTEESPLIITNENDLQQLLKTLYSDGKFDIAFSHHEDSPKSHHEDITRISHHDEHSHHHHHNEDTHDHRHKKHYKTHTHIEDEGLPSVTNIENLNLFLKKKLKNADDNYDYDETEDSPSLRSEDNARSVSNVDQVVNLLHELGNKVSAENRCVGDRCGRGRSGDNEDDTKRSNNIYDNLLCFGDECGRDDVNVEDRADCVGDRCGLSKLDDDDAGYDRDDDNDNTNIARCSGDSCGIDQTLLRERRLPIGDSHIARLFQSQGRKIKVSDDLDALVLDLSDVEKYLGNSRVKERDENERSKLQLFKDVDISNLLEANNYDDEESVRDQNVLASESKPIKAVVVDLSKTQNDLTNQINDLMRNIQSPLKKYKRIKASSIKNNVLSRGDSKILSHDEDNNHVYVPKWLLDEIVTKTNSRDSETQLRNVFPLTLKQKERRAKAQSKPLASQRVFRRSINDDIGVPFHLQIEGLGQVEP